MRVGLLLVAMLIAGAGASPLRAEVRNPYGVAVIIGNKTYQDHGIPEVSFADRDAQAIKSYVIDVLGYSPDNILYIENATQAQLLSVFGSESNPEGKLADYLRPGKKSDVLVYYSGHGVPAPGAHAGDAAEAQADLLPSDADPSTLGQNGFPVQLLLDNLRQLDAKSVTVLLDACFTGMSGGGTLLPHASVVTRAATPVTAGEAGGMTVITAAQADQLANWDTVKKHGLFTEYFLEAVYGRADDAQYGGHGDGKITLGAVQQYLDDEMSYVARRQFGRKQKATVTGDTGTVLASLTPDRIVRHEGLAPPAATAPPAPVATGPQPDEDALKLTGADRRAVQQWLTALGHPTGGIDGVFGPGTRAAIGAYQGSIGMAATGFLTRDVVARLRRDAPAPTPAPGEKMAGVAQPPPQPKPPADQTNAADANAKGDAAYDAKDYAEALRWYRKAADQGFAPAQKNIGFLYQYGWGVAQDYAEAMRWYRKAADQGNADAQNNIGFLYQDGWAVAQDYAEAMRWYRKAAAQGLAAAQTNIGFFYQKGWGVPQDYVEAMRWYRKAAEQGNARAQFHIGVLYAEGRGVDKNPDEARRWFRLAAAQGEPDAKASLALLGE